MTDKKADAKGIMLGLLATCISGMGDCPTRPCTSCERLVKAIAQLNHHYYDKAVGCVPDLPQEVVDCNIMIKPIVNKIKQNLAQALLGRKEKD